MDTTYQMSVANQGKTAPGFVFTFKSCLSTILLSHMHMHCCFVPGDDSYPFENNDLFIFSAFFQTPLTLRLELPIFLWGALQLFRVSHLVLGLCKNHNLITTIFIQIVMGFDDTS